MNKGKFIILLALLLALACSQQVPEISETDFAEFVDPYIGSDYHGHVFVGASVPFGAVQLGPNNETQGWDWCSGYHYSDSVLVGFAHTHLSGTGIGDLGDVVFMPVSDQYNPEEDKEIPFNWKSHYSHDRESAEPGYYFVHVERYNIDAHLTATERVGVHKYDYMEGENSSVIIDLHYGTGWDQLQSGQIKQVNTNSIEGHRISRGWANDQRVFFHTEFSKEITQFELIASHEKAGQVTARISFNGTGELLVKTAISPVSSEGAKANLIAEADHWDFDRIKNQAWEKWNNELGKIKIESGSLANKRTFYTALYHTMIAPSLFNDANGDYRGADKEVHINPGYNTYTTLSLWDTYRAAHPLFTIFQPERVDDFINTMLAIYEQQGKLPIWHLHGNETNTMVGYSALPVIADAYLKGFRGFDAELAFEAMKTSALLDERGGDYVKIAGVHTRRFTGGIGGTGNGVCNRRLGAGCYGFSNG
jgi:predicted alpha-1,2-mannosidase